jgi:hypothetical protein
MYNSSPPDSSTDPLHSPLSVPLHAEPALASQRTHRRDVDDRIEPVLLETKHDQGGFLKEIMKNGILIQDS